MPQYLCIAANADSVDINKPFPGEVAANQPHKNNVPQNNRKLV
jgi:hypothetical protein